MREVQRIIARGSRFSTIATRVEPAFSSVRVMGHSHSSLVSWGSSPTKELSFERCGEGPIRSMMYALGNSSSVDALPLLVSLVVLPCSVGSRSLACSTCYAGTANRNGRRLEIHDRDRKANDASRGHPGTRRGQEMCSPCDQASSIFCERKSCVDLLMKEMKTEDVRSFWVMSSGATWDFL